MAAVTSPDNETLPLCTDKDVLLVCQTVRTWMVAQHFGLLDRTRMVTATSELARNAVVYGGGGSARLERLGNGERPGLRVTIEDQGPGIVDIEQALMDGFTTGGGLGLGLGGSKRLVDEFGIWSEPGRGTRVSIVRWK